MTTARWPKRQIYQSFYTLKFTWMSFPPCFQRFQWCTDKRAQACSIVAGKWETCRFPATSAILWCSNSSMPLSSSKTTSWDTLCPFISTTTLEKRERELAIAYQFSWFQVCPAFLSFFRSLYRAAFVTCLWSECCVSDFWLKRVIFSALCAQR